MLPPAIRFTLRLRPLELTRSLVWCEYVSKNLCTCYMLTLSVVGSCTQVFLPMGGAHHAASHWCQIYYTLALAMQAHSLGIFRCMKDDLGLAKGHRGTSKGPRGAGYVCIMSTSMCVCLCVCVCVSLLCTITLSLLCVARHGSKCVKLMRCQIPPEGSQPRICT
jgi:hypothetical protein